MALPPVNSSAKCVYWETLKQKGWLLPCRSSLTPVPSSPEPQLYTLRMALSPCLPASHRSGLELQGWYPLLVCRRFWKLEGLGLFPDHVA